MNGFADYPHRYIDPTLDGFSLLGSLNDYVAREYKVTSTSPGLYAFFVDGLSLYLGRASRLRRRLRKYRGRFEDGGLSRGVHDGIAPRLAAGQTISLYVLELPSISA
jgi:hypothetical protein